MQIEFTKVPNWIIASKELSSNEIDSVLAELHLISHLIKQLKLVLRIEIEESYIYSIRNEI